MSATDPAVSPTGTPQREEETLKSGRPQSLLAESFASQLNDIFLINDTIDQLASSVENKRFSLTTHNLELSALEARLKRTEELLEQKKKRLSLPVNGKPPMPTSPPPPPPVSGGAPSQNDGAGEAKEGFVVVERSPSVVNAVVTNGVGVGVGVPPPMPTRMPPPVPTE
ncbi:hypothetical protein BDZ91DRAFT_851752 [Kalaharituber pfeilii]|nr:hypothetical protein BDZ91DRAFT_851752 [Kalaharituber pfeilii]